MRIAVGADHAGYELKNEIAATLKDLGYEVTDFGTNSPAPVDYPDIALAVARAVAAGDAERGILVCGTGIGTCIVANKVRGVRAALCHDTFSARVTREHNDSNVLCLGARVIGPSLALEVVRTWLRGTFERGGRHERRVRRITEIENDRGEPSPAPPGARGAAPGGAPDPGAAAR